MNPNIKLIVGNRYLAGEPEQDHYFYEIVLVQEVENFKFIKIRNDIVPPMLRDIVGRFDWVKASEVNFIADLGPIHPK